MYTPEYIYIHPSFRCTSFRRGSRRRGGWIQGNKESELTGHAVWEETSTWIWTLTRAVTRLIPWWKPRTSRSFNSNSLQSKANHLGLFQDLCQQPEPPSEACIMFPSLKVFLYRTPLISSYSGQSPCSGQSWVPLHPQSPCLKKTGLEFLPHNSL